MTRRAFFASTFGAFALPWVPRPQPKFIITDGVCRLFVFDPVLGEAIRCADTLLSPDQRKALTRELRDQADAMERHGPEARWGRR